MGKTSTKLAIFNRYKTKDVLTGEAGRQRSIITILASKGNPMEKTRTGISQLIAQEHGNAWKNIYSGVFRDLDEVLIPMGMAEEHGRLPLKRGPKALQEKGVPYYHLTRRGTLLAIAICNVSEQKRLLDEFFSEPLALEKRFQKIITSLQAQSPNFTHSILEKYVRAFCDGKFADLLPFDPTRLRDTHDQSLAIHREMLEAFMTLSRHDMEETMEFLDMIADVAE